MTAFHFRAATADNRPQIGVIEAADETEAARLLIDRGLYPVELSAKDWNWLDLLNKKIGNSLSPTEASQILADLGYLLTAGVELAVALNVMTSTRPQRRIQDILEELLREVRRGRSLSSAMAALRPIAFPSHVIAVIQAGEISGALAEALTQAGANVRQMALLKSKVRTALIYPSCVAVAAVFAIVILLTVVVPALEAIFADGLQRLPWQTQILVLVGGFIRAHVMFLAAFAIAAGAGARLLYQNTAVRMRLERIALRTPVLGTLLATAETARVAATLALLSSSGLPLAKAITIARDCTRLNVTHHAFLRAAHRLREGAHLHEALSSVEVLGPRVLALVRIGEMTGRLNVLLAEAARDAEQRVTTAIERMLALLTPGMTLLFGSIAGFVLYAVMTAILSVNELATTTH
jgi:general secretion pathway protein F